MKLVASAIVRNEAGRYLEPWLDHLLAFCDELRIYDDGSRDGTADILAEYERDNAVEVMTGVFDVSLFDQHEGKARQRLLDWTLEGEPTHVLAVDADEFVTDGSELRRMAVQQNSYRRNHPRLAGAWMVRMEEIWELDGDCLCVREDRLWQSHMQPVLWAVPSSVEGTKWQIQNKALASGRIPRGAYQARAKAVQSVSILHFGWTNVEQRQARYDRYMRIDGGRYHLNNHLESIMAPESEIRLRGRRWPWQLDAQRAEITRRAGYEQAVDVS